MNFSFVHDFDIDVDGYWQVFLSDDYNVDLYKQLKMKQRVVLEQTDDGKIFRRRQKLEPTTPVPAFIASMVKETGYTEIDTLDRATSAMDVVIEPEMFKDRFKMRGVYAVTPLDGGKRCRREFRGEVKVSMPLIGGKVEKYMMEQLRDAYDLTARITQQWIAKRKAS